MMLEGLLSSAGDLPEGDLSASWKVFREAFPANRRRGRDMESEYLRIFDMGKIISPYETEYLQEKISRKPFELADVAGFYQAFGFDVNDGEEHRESVDHIAVELEFMAILAYKELYAEERGQEEHLMVVREAQKKFLHEHLARWGYFFCSRLQKIACEGYYKQLGNMLESVLNAECEKHGLDISRYEKELNRDVPGTGREEELTCGQQIPAGGV
jgi:TorA maturation chaperone TorD